MLLMRPGGVVTTRSRPSPLRAELGRPNCPCGLTLPAIVLRSTRFTLLLHGGVAGPSCPLVLLRTIRALIRAGPKQGKRPLPNTNRFQAIGWVQPFKYPQESRRSFSQLIRHPSSFEQAATQVLDLRSLRRPGPTIQETRTLACADSLSRKRKQCPERSDL